MSLLRRRRERFASLVFATWVSVFVVALATVLACERPVVAPGQLVLVAPSSARRIVIDVDAADRLGIRTHSVGATTFAATIAVPGSIELDPTRYAEVGPRLEGRVVSLHARLGDRVKKGQLLAVLVAASLADAQASVLTSKATLKAAEQNRAREEQLFAERLTSARDYELSGTTLTRAQAESDAAEARLVALGATGGVGGALRLTAPIDGVVVQRPAVLGGHLASSAHAFALADLSRLVATLEVHEADLPYLVLGSETRFLADGLPERHFAGIVAWIDPLIDKTTRIVKARLEVDNADGALRPGMFLRALLPLPAAKSGGPVRVPIEAVQPLGEQDVAFVESAPGVYEVRVLTLGRRTGEVIEVRAGLAHGERVVVEGAFLVRAEASLQ